jgi:hypothetical protein
MVSVIAPQASAQVNVERAVSGECEVGDNIEVTLVMSVGENVPAGAVVAEKLHENLTYISSEPEGVFRENTRELEWLFYGEALASGEITYIVVPEHEGEIRFEGVVKMVRNMTLTTKDIVGDNLLVVRAKSLLTGASPEIAAALVLVLAIVFSLGILFRKHARR